MPSTVLYFNPAAEFSVANNPNAVWTHGYEPTLGVGFTTYAQHSTTYPQIDSWVKGGGADGNPGVYHNSTANTIILGGTAIVNPGELIFHPGPAGEYSIVRFIAPNNGRYQIKADFSVRDINPGGTDVHVLVNGAPVFDSPTTTASFSSQELALAAGATIDFAVGYGSNNTFYNDSTGLAVTITGFNEPPTFASLSNHTVDEGQAVFLSFQVNDPDLPAQALTLQVNWADGSLPETFNVTPGETVTLTHVYLDDDPTGTPKDDYKVDLNLNDGVGGIANQTVTVTVQNVAPTAVLLTDYWQSPTDPVTVAFEDVFDPGTLDTFTYSFDWNGDGDFDDLDEGPGFYPSRSHLFEDGQVHTVNGLIEDDDGGQAFVQIPVHQLQIASVEWVASDNSPLDANPGGGLRIFPDDVQPNEVVSRTRVFVRVTLTQPPPGVSRAGVRLYVRLYDVDDPSANPEDADDAMSIVDDESRPSDNRAALFFPQDFSFTGDNGQVLILFRVRFRPGDNYRAVAAFRANVFNGFTARQNDGVLARVLNDAGQGPARSGLSPPDRVMQAADMLTVWRRLHVEVDSMGRVRGNTFRGQIDRVGAGDPGISIVFTRHNLDDSANRFVNGRLTDSMRRVFTVVENSRGPNLEIKVENLANGVQPAVGEFSLKDDDLLQDGEDVPMPDTSTLAAAMAEAYVQVLFDFGASYINNEVTFVLNVPDPNANAADNAAFRGIIATDWTSRNSNSSTFWVAYVLGAFQHSQGLDADPISESVVSGITGNPEGGSLIYIESIRDIAPFVPGFTTVAAMERDTVVHEVGHAVANFDNHPVTGADAQANRWAIGTTSPGPGGGIKVAHHNPSRYQPAYLARIRSTTRPRGPNP